MATAVMVGVTRMMGAMVLVVGNGDRLELQR